MPQRFLLDTSALLVHYRRETGWEQVQALFEQSDTEILAASVSLTEFARRLRVLGASAGEARKTAVDYKELLDELIAVDEAVALTAFDIGCETPQRLPLTDALIAAAAREHNASLVHRDQHMVSIPRSAVEQLDLSLERESPPGGAT